MKDIAIFGAGGLGRETAILIDYINKAGGDWNLLGYFDDGKEKGMQISHFGKVLGGMDEINAWPTELALVLAIGNPKSVKGVRERIISTHIYFPNLIAPTATIADPETFSIGEGNIIGGGTWISTDVKIGSYNLFNGDTVMGHDVTIGDYNTIMPDIRISGEVTIGNGNLLGVGSIILQQIKIGNGVHLGAGAVLLTKAKDNCTYLGNPAKRFKY
jgi:sugar O-acyltransferase (sialic acid O-acetyltransferase NeuD family)